MTKAQFDQHSKILGWLFVILNVLGLLVGGFLFVLFLVVGLFSGDPDAVAPLLLTAFIVAVVFGVLSIPGIITGWGLLKRAAWGRILGIILGILSLPSFPLGTALGVYALYILFQNGAEEYFAKQGQGEA